MADIASILFVVERNEDALQAFNKACALARQLGARLELFLCDAERGYALRHSWDQTGIERAATALIDDAKHYLDALRRSVVAPELQISVDASCETPLYQGIVQKVLLACPDLVIKAIGGAGGAAAGGGAESSPDARTAPSLNDWHLVRTCPVPLLLTRHNPWRAAPRIAASIDLTDAETPGLARQIVETASSFARRCHGELDLVFARGPGQNRARAPNGSIEALDALAREFEVPPARVHALGGEPGEVLPAHVARGHYDLLVLGALTHARGLTDLVGTLTDRLLQSLDCDFLLLKPGTYSCPIRPGARSTLAAT